MGKRPTVSNKQIEDVLERLDDEDKYVDAMDEAMGVIERLADERDSLAKTLFISSVTTESTAKWIGGDESARGKSLAVVVDEVERLRAECDRLKAENERLHKEREEELREKLRVEDDLAEAEERVLEVAAENERLTRERDDAEERAREAEREAETLREDVREHLPEYVLDDGTGDEAGERERIEYAGDEIRRLRAMLESHGPEGRNVTNAEHVRVLDEIVEMRARADALARERDDWEEKARWSEQVRKAQQAVRDGDVCRLNRERGGDPCGVCLDCVKALRKERDALTAHVERLTVELTRYGIPEDVGDPDRAEKERAALLASTPEESLALHDEALFDRLVGAMAKAAGVEQWERYEGEDGPEEWAAYEVGSILALHDEGVAHRFRDALLAAAYRRADELDETARAIRTDGEERRDEAEDYEYWASIVRQEICYLVANLSWPPTKSTDDGEGGR